MKLCHGLSIVLAVVLVLGVGTSEVAAWEQWAQGCNSCHGAFRTNNYVSLVDGQAWGQSVHKGHEDFLNGDCDACHMLSGKSPVYLASSGGGTGLAAIGCLGCHGRDEGAGVTGAGLRQHHFRTGQALCGNPFCHWDGDPAAYTPVPENILPPYYASPGTGHSNMPEHPCNLAGYGFSEDCLGSSLGGLDNDGDDAYDIADTDCAAVVPIEPSTWGRIKSLYK